MCLDPQTGEILMKCNEELTAETLQLFREKKIPLVPVYPYR